MNRCCSRRFVQRVNALFLRRDFASNPRPLRNDVIIAGNRNFVVSNFRLSAWKSQRSFGTEAISFHVQDLNDFKERVLENKKPVVVDFFADWCGPCKILGPRLEKKIDGKNGTVLMAKVNVDDHGELAMEYGVEAVPTVIAFKNGEIVEKFVGAKDDAEIEIFLQKITK